MPDDSELEKATERWEEAKARGDTIAQHLAKGFSVGIGIADPVLGALASLATVFIPSRRAKRLEEFAEQIASDLRALREAIDATYIRSDEFAHIFEQSFRGVAENYQEEKVAAFRGILVNAPIRRDVSEDEKQYFLSLVSSLTPLHIRLLRFLDDPAAYAAAAGLSESSIDGGFRRFLPVVISGVRVEVLESAFADLYQMGMINTAPSIFTTMTSAGGLQLARGRVTPLGQLFVSFITAPR